MYKIVKISDYVIIALCLLLMALYPAVWLIIIMLAATVILPVLLRLWFMAGIRAFNNASRDL